MKRSFRMLLLCVLIGCMMISGISFAEENGSTEMGKVSQVIAFGDSFSDNGAAQRISAAILKDPNKPEKAYQKPAAADSGLYWWGRYSNGYTAVEVLANQLNVKLTDYAVGGATSGDHNYSAWMDFQGNTGVLGQVAAFTASLNGATADPEALYFIWASANDYYLFMDYEMPGYIGDVAKKSVDNISTAIYRLARLGAKKFLVVNSADLATLPYEIIYQRTEAAGKFTRVMNKSLPFSMNYIQEKTGVSIMLFDNPAVFKMIQDNPQKYGIVELTTPCERTWPEIKAAAAEPDQYYFWDEYHPTRAAHRVLANEMYSQMQRFFQ